MGEERPEIRDRRWETGDGRWDTGYRRQGSRVIYIVFFLVDNGSKLTEVTFGDSVNE